MNSAVPGATPTSPAAPVELAAVQIRAVRLQSHIELGQPVGQPPRVAVSARFHQEPRPDGSWFVVLELRAEAHAGEQPLFTASVEQGAILQPGAAAVAAGDAAALVLGRGPALVYPFARQLLGDLLDGSQFTGFRLGVACPPVDVDGPSAA